ncbi:IPP transferase-domain-containing protein [Aspergillus karnatakaensis]|uniref:tRNA dimethylallyltransferase n=1 Tax=Aspergillus karnatakaensis TaxID=1810916 RepID=UPI003CCD5543
MFRYLFSSSSTSRPSAMQSLVAVVGATGTGKSKLAVEIASRFNGEIINGDAMQMYRGLPIITNQIPIEERNGIPHHLISCIDLDEEAWRIGIFRKECLRLINDIHARGKLPVLVGGTHYYTQSVLFQDSLVTREPLSFDEEIDLQPTEDAKTAAKWPILDAEPEVVLRKLREVDPAMADRWHPKDRRKIRRSLEIYFQTGKPASQVYAEQRQLKQAAAESDTSGPGAGQLRFDTMLLWVHAEKPILNERLNKRVGVMIDQGLLSEAHRMWTYIQDKEAQGISVDQTRGVWVSIGFKELAPYFDMLRDGTKTKKELEDLKELCVELVQTATRQYAGSQIKWIRNKLWTGLARVGMNSRLFVLDSTNIGKWTENITEPSERLVEALLTKKTLPDPKTLSELARTTLEAREAQPQSIDHNTVKCITCDVCHKTMTNEEQWQVHIHSSGHKRALKSRAKKTARDEYLRKRQESLENDQKAVLGTEDNDSEKPPKQPVE